MKVAIVNKIFEIFCQNTPNPRTELEYSNNFTLAVAVILSAQATDISVNKATKNLFVKYDTPEKILSLGIDGLKQYIRTIGLYNTKAKNIISLCEILINQYNATIPSDFDSLYSLPGIGRKTANVILNCAFGKSVMPVDTHVHRVSNRIGFSDGKKPNKVESDLMKIIPQKWLFYAHHWLILHGRYVCKARKPLCKECSVNTYCHYYQKNNENK